MDPNTPVEEQDLVDDSVAQAIDDAATPPAEPGSTTVPADDTPAADPASEKATPPAEPVQDVTAPKGASTPPLTKSDVEEVNNQVLESLDQLEDPQVVAPTHEELAVKAADEPTQDTPAKDDKTDDEEKPKDDETPSPLGEGSDEDLMEIKQKALEDLSPLVSHLDLPPEKRFDTYMEILRASDDKHLVKAAFDAAEAIEDEDKKAQALLDIVNEVNYLTQDHNKE